MTITTILTYADNTDNLAPGVAFHIRFSQDYGATWTDEDKFTDGASVTGFPLANDQAVNIYCPNGNLLIPGSTTSYRSTDLGKTWTTETPTITGVPAGYAEDYLVMSDQAFVYDGVIYISCIMFTAAWANHGDILLKSTDNGVNWAYVGNYGVDAIGEAGICYIGNDTIVAMLRPVSGYPKLVYSYDMGVTWTTAVDMISIGYGGRFHIWTRAQLKGEANWWTDPVLIMSGFSYVAGEGRYNTIWVSRDSGKTWCQGLYLGSPTWLAGWRCDTATTMGGYGDTFYDPNNDQYVFVSYMGTNLTADIMQYNVTITGI